MTLLKGGTLGKKLLGLRIVSAVDVGESPSARALLVRWATMLALCLLIVGPIIDLLWMLLDSDRQAVHDKAAGTFVV
jgi:uncharacterized RDD family membrane protein YckC